MKAAALGLAFVISLAGPLAPMAVSAQHGGGGGGHGGGGGGGGPRGGGGGGGGPRGGGGGGGPRGGGAAPRAEAPRAMSAPSAERGGFDLSPDVNAGARRQEPVQNSARPPEASGGRPVTNEARPSYAGGERGAGGNGGQRSHNVIENSRYHDQRAWGWNRGVAWDPAPRYWGGGFWGPFGFGLGAFYGSYDNTDSYEVEPESPGASLLSDYQLTQTQCGAPDLVVIYGPDNSVICAYPNNLVSPGSYDIDPSNLTLVSQ